MKTMVNMKSINSVILFIMLLSLSLVAAVAAKDKEEAQVVVFESGFINPPDDSFNQTHGPFDVSAFSEIRILVVNDNTSPTLGVDVKPVSVLPSGAEIELGVLGVLDRPGASATDIYRLYGPSVKVIVESITGNTAGLYNISIIGGY